MSLRTIIEKAGNFISAKRRINLIEGSNITLTVVENGEKVDITIASTGGGGGSGLSQQQVEGLI
jgi:hypothetical protein